MSVIFLSPSFSFSLFLAFLFVCLFQSLPSFCVLQEFGQAPGAGDGQGSLACCSPWGRKESDMTQQLNSKVNEKAAVLTGRPFCYCRCNIPRLSQQAKESHHILGHFSVL